MGRSFSCLAARSMASYNDDAGEDDVDDDVGGGSGGVNSNGDRSI